MAITNPLLPTEGTTTSTGNQDDFDFSNCSLLRCDNATLLTLRGLVAGRPGQQLWLVSVGAGQVDLANEDTNSVSSNRIVNGVTATISLSSAVGRAELVYDGTSARWRVVSYEQGAWITPTFLAGDYTGGGAQTWTVASGDVSACTVINFNRDIAGALNWSASTDTTYVWVEGVIDVA